MPSFREIWEYLRSEWPIIWAARKPVILLLLLCVVGTGFLLRAWYSNQIANLQSANTQLQSANTNLQSAITNLQTQAATKTPTSNEVDRFLHPEPDGHPAAAIRMGNGGTLTMIYSACVGFDACADVGDNTKVLGDDFYMRKY